MFRNAGSGNGRWAVVFGLVVLLLFAAIVITPWALTQWAESRFTRTLGAPVHLERITLNPFTATARFSGLDIGEPRTPMITVPSGEVMFAWSTLWQSGIQVRQVRLEAPRLHLVSRADGSLNVATLGSEGAAGSSGSASSQADSEASPLTIARLEAHGGRIDWQDRRTPENASLRASDVEVTLHDYRLGSGRPMHGQATATLGGGTVDLEGAFGIQPFTGDLAVTTQQVAAAPLDPWLTAAVPARIDAGRFDLDGRLRFGAASEALIAYRGQVALTGFETHAPQGQPLFSLAQGRFEKVDFASGKQLRVASATLTGPKLTAQLGESGQFNLAEALGRGQDDAPRAGGDETGSGGAEAGSSGGDDTDSGGDNGADENGGRGREGQGGGLSVALDHLGIEQGEFDFEDRRMSPTVALDIDELEGELNGLDSRSDAPVSYRFDGMESDGTPVMIEGEASFGDSLEARLRLTTERLALSEFAPYIRRFAGYRIDSGSADLDLNYQLRDGALTARNHIIIKQLDLGEQTDQDETSLPLKKLVGLLQAESGVIDLDIPIETTVDGDTQVDMSVVIWQAIRESLANLLTSPVDSLQALIGGDNSAD
ncbi:DUF748 domain-containing protein [Salinicola avicenniae]|uniref:DUF748 domain-containing protein n=1 Tax=Salinicola avicenniae TaxID=2916836 RepID=UPI002072F291|nr:MULTISPECIES: DUF748 domain-containing protein [unclassified Salinicola]